MFFCTGVLYAVLLQTKVRNVQKIVYNVMFSYLKLPNYVFDICIIGKSLVGKERPRVRVGLCRPRGPYEPLLTVH